MAHRRLPWFFVALVALVAACAGEKPADSTRSDGPHIGQACLVLRHAVDELEGARIEFECKGVRATTMRADAPLSDDGLMAYELVWSEPVPASALLDEHSWTVEFDGATFVLEHLARLAPIASDGRAELIAALVHADDALVEVDVSPLAEHGALPTHVAFGHDFFGAGSPWTAVDGDGRARLHALPGSWRLFLAGNGYFPTQYEFTVDRRTQYERWAARREPITWIHPPVLRDTLFADAWFGGEHVVVDARSVGVRSFAVVLEDGLPAPRGTRLTLHLAPHFDYGQPPATAVVGEQGLCEFRRSASVDRELASEGMSESESAFDAILPQGDFAHGVAVLRYGVPSELALIRCVDGQAQRDERSESPAPWSGRSRDVGRADLASRSNAEGEFVTTTLSVMSASGAPYALQLVHVRKGESPEPLQAWTDASGRLEVVTMRNTTFEVNVALRDAFDGFAPGARIHAGTDGNVVLHEANEE